MFKEVLANMNGPWLPSAGLLIFLGVFIGAFLYCLRKGSNDIYSEASKLPFDEGTRQ